MLKRFLAQRLSRYVRGLGSEQVSARLLSGKLSLSDVEINLEAVADLLVGLLPHTVELHKVSCKTVAAKVPWQAPRRHPICVELRGVEVELVVHGPSDEVWLAAQTSAQRRQLERIASRTEETLRDDDEEDQRQLRDVEAQLKVGLQNVVVDGLRVSVNDVQVTLRQALAPTESHGIAFALRLSSVIAVPCNRSGVLVDRPQDVYEINDDCVRVHRLVEIHGFRIESVAAGNATSSSSSGDATNQPAARPSQPGQPSFAMEHVDEESGCMRVWVQQQRLAGFLPNHRARRVCPFSSEAVVGVQVGILRLRAAESHLCSLARTVVDAIAPPYVQLESLPPNLAHLHWRSAGASSVGESSSAKSRSSSISPAVAGVPSGPTAPSMGKASGPGVVAPPVSSQCASSSSPFAMPNLVSAADTGLRIGVSDAMRWSEPVLAVEAALGLEAREHFVERQLVRLAALRLNVHTLAVAVSAEEPGAVDSTFCLFANTNGTSFARDDVFLLESFERRCLVELGFAESRGSFASTEANAQPVSGNVSSSKSRSGIAESAVAREVAAERLQRAARARLARRRLRELRENVGSIGAVIVETLDEGDKAHADVHGRDVKVGSGTSISEPTPRQAAASVNYFALGAWSLRWRRGLLDSECAPERPLLSSKEQKDRPAMTFGWKEAQAQQPSLGNFCAHTTNANHDSWQPMEGCVHGLVVTVDTDGMRCLSSISKSMDTALENFKAPLFESGWMRFAVHGVTVQVPPRQPGLRGSLPLPGVVVEVPELLVTSLLGIGELFCGLGSVPSQSEWRMPAKTASMPSAKPHHAVTPKPPSPPLTARSSATAADCNGGRGDGYGSLERVVGSASSAEVDLATTKGAAAVNSGGLSLARHDSCVADIATPNESQMSKLGRIHDALREARASACPCGRVIADGAVRLGTGFRPVRTQRSSRSWAMRQRASLGTSEGSGCVAMRREELADLLRARVSAESLAAVMPRLREIWEDGASDESASVDFGDFPRRPSDSPKRRALGARRFSKTCTSPGVVAADVSGVASGATAATQLCVGSVEEIAAQWALLLEVLRKLRAEREEVNLRCAALRVATSAEVKRVETRCSARERELASQISVERLRQAELAAKAEEQRQALDRLVRILPPSTLAGLGSASAKQASLTS